MPEIHLNTKVITVNKINTPIRIQFFMQYGKGKKG